MTDNSRKVNPIVHPLKMKSTMLQNGLHERLLNERQLACVPILTREHISEAITVMLIVKEFGADSDRDFWK